MKKIYLTFLLTLILSQLLAKTIMVAGKVVDENNEPIENVNIYTDSQGITTDENGFFEFSVHKQAFITFSHIGYEKIIVSAKEIAKIIYLSPISLNTEKIYVRSGLREVSLLGAPSSVTIFRESNIDNEPSHHFQGLTNLIPNLNWAGGTSRPRYFQIRGIGERSLNANEGPPNFSVGFIIDDIDFTGIGMPAILIDMKQIEVFRGPQSSIFGANAMAGLISMHTHDPKNQFEAMVQTGVATDNGKNMGAMINAPIVKNLSTRFTIYSGQENGFRENVYKNTLDSNGKSEMMVRNKTLWTPNPKFQVKLTSLFANQDNKYDVWAPDNNETLQTYSDNEGKDSQESQSFSLRSSLRNIGNIDLISITSYSKNESEHSYDADWGNAEFWSKEPYNFDGGDYNATETTLRDRTTKTQELRLLGNLKHNSSFTSGIYLKNQFDKYDSNASWGSLSGTFENLNIAGYFQINRTISKKFKLIINSRLEHNKIKYRSNNYYGAIDDNIDNDNNNWGIKTALSYKLKSSSNLYISLSRGYKSGGINQNPLLSLLHRTYGPESNINYELGFKHYTQSLQTQLTCFYMSRKDQQVSISNQQDDTDPTSFVFYTANATTGYNYGSEFDFTLIVNKNLSLIMNMGYLTTHVDSYESYILVNDVITLIIAGDRDQAQAPKYTYSVGCNYNLPYGLTLGMNITGKDKFYFSDSHNLQSEPYQLANINVNYNRDNWSISAWGKNILDTRYAVRGFYFGLEPPNYEDKLYVHWGDPVQYGISLSYQF